TSAPGPAHTHGLPAPPKSPPAASRRQVRAAPLEGAPRRALRARDGGGGPARRSEVTPPALGRGVRLFNRGRYLSAQEVWEEAWRAAPAEERGFLEGLVQLAAALHLRTRRGATRGSVH